MYFFYFLCCLQRKDMSNLSLDFCVSYVAEWSRQVRCFMPCSLTCLWRRFESDLEWDSNPQPQSWKGSIEENTRPVPLGHEGSFRLGLQLLLFNPIPVFRKPKKNWLAPLLHQGTSYLAPARRVQCSWKIPRAKEQDEPSSCSCKATCLFGLNQQCNGLDQLV